MHAIVTKGTPTIFAFHGTGGDEHQFAGLVRELWPGAGLVAPRGEVSEHGANRFFRRTAEGVYDMDDLWARTDAMTRFVRGHAGPAYAFGYSNGANILAAMSFKAPDLFARVALLHPLIPFAPPPAAFGGLPVLITGGRRDPICPLPMTEGLAGYYENQQAEVTLHLHEGGHEIRPSEITALQGFFKD
ncbi:alpha/beta hydrolase [Falsirhodobacter xinxiangensis]|uniref:alpha/beta hydrolase n=1 Tax=Falsirhodobacter xinxiangensis TaxID=2530049 RepID=UPI0010AA178C|nr:alpha/beta hydrolase [Rhodobacter xinxiangensis]